MFTSEELSRAVSGWYFLSNQGAIGRYQIDSGFNEDLAWTQRLGNVVQQSLRVLDKEPLKDYLFIGLVFPATEDKAWNSPTLWFTDYVVETLYPVHGVRTGMLTAFQKRKREHSIHQGIELLLTFRRETFPERPLFCPALIDRNKPLGEYSELLGREVGGDEGAMPVLEVVNLFGLITSDDPNHAAIVELCTHLTKGIINKELRKGPAFGLDSDTADSPAIRQAHHFSARPSSESTPGKSTAFSLSPPNQTTLDPEPMAVGQAAPDTGQPAATSSNPFHRSEPVSVDLLRRFVLFAQMDHNRAEQLAQQLALESAQPGSRIIIRDSVDQWFYFLVDGMVVLRAADGNSRRIEAGSEPALHPLSRLLPRKYDVSAMTPVRYFRVHQSLLEQFVTH